MRDVYTYAHAPLVAGIVVSAAAVARTFGAIAKERLAASVVLLVLVLGAENWSGITLLVAVDLVLLLTLVIEHVRIEHPGHSPRFTRS